MKPVETALDVAMLVMQNGGSTSKADQTFHNVLRGFKQDGISTVWRLDFVVASSVTEGESTTILRQVGGIGINLVRTSEAVILGERVAIGEVHPGDIPSEIQRIKSLGSPFNRWIILMAAASTAGAFSQLGGGDWRALGIAGLAAAIGQFFRSRLQARKLSVAPVTLISGVISACLAAVGLWLNLTQTSPITLIASVIYLAPGLPLINGFVDMQSHKYLYVGLERIANAVFLFLILAICIAFASTIIL